MVWKEAKRYAPESVWLIPNAERRKLVKKAEKLRFVGYSKESKGDRLLDERTRKIGTRRDLIFNEADFGIRAETETIKHKETVEVDPKKRQQKKGDTEKMSLGAQTDRSNRLSDMVLMNMQTQCRSKTIYRLQYVSDSQTKNHGESSGKASSQEMESSS